MSVLQTELEASPPRMAEAMRRLEEASSQMQRSVEELRLLTFAQDRRNTPEAAARLEEIHAPRDGRFSGAVPASEYIAEKRAERGL